MSRVARPVCETGKRRYGSAGEARDAMRSAGNRVRVYFCKRCGDHHVTDDDKGSRLHRVRS